MWNILLGSFRELVEYLNDSTELLSKNSNILDNVLETLDMQQHQIGVLFILVAKISEIQVSDWILKPTTCFYKFLFTFN